MALTDITKKIIDDAEAEGKRLRDHAEAEVRRLENETDTKKKSLREESVRELFRVSTENERRVASAAREAARLRANKTKREILDDVYKKAEARFSELSEGYKKQLSEFVQSLPSEVDGTLFVPRGRKFETKDVLLSFGYSLDVEEDENIDIGFCFKSDSFEYNSTPRKILEQKREVLDVSVSKILFPVRSE